MVSSPVHNLSDFLKNRPPLVVFLICLVALAVSTFYFAFEIEKDGPSINSDKKHDWIKMLKHFNKIDTCINFSTWTNEIDKIEEDTLKDEISVHTKVTVENIDNLRPFSKVHGALTLDGWYSVSCQDIVQQPKDIKVFFDVPVLDEKVNNSHEICVTIKGPAQYLPYFKESLCKPSVRSKDVKGSKGFLSSKLPRYEDKKFCENGKITKFVFHLEQSGIANYLSDDIRTQIYIHLMWCSYFLVFLIFCILMFAILKTPEDLDKKELGARLL